MHRPFGVRPPFFTAPGSKSSAPRSCRLIQKLKHNHILSADQTVSEFISAKLRPSLPLNHYTVEPNSVEEKTRNCLTSCKSFSGRASELVSDLQVIIDPTVTKSSSTIARPATTVDEEGGSEDQVEGKSGEGDFFDQAEVSDDQVDYDSWESGSIHSGGRFPVGYVH